MTALWPDNRAVTVQIGAVLLLGVLVLLMTINQAAIVPAQNQNVEFAHNDRVQSDLLDVRNGLIRAAASGNTQPNSVEMGTSFPSRLIAINPAPASGSLAPSSVSGNATVSGVVPVDRNAREYWANESHSMQYETTGFRYQPSYREYGTAPSTVYENTVLYNEFADGQTRPLTGQSVVDGRTISLVALRDVPTRSSSSTVGMDLRAISPSSTQVRTIAVTPGEEPVTVTLPTQLDEETWTELLADEPYVEAVGVADSEVTILLAETRGGEEVTYNLRTSAVTANRSVERPEPAYVTVVDGANRSVPENTTNTLTAEVRDRYNNPVSGATVDAEFEEAASVSSLQVRSTEQGFAPFSFETTGDGSAHFGLAGSTQQATVSLFSFQPDDSTPIALRSPATVSRTSSTDGRVQIPYSADGTGSLTATLNAVSTGVSTAALHVYSLGSSITGPVRFNPETGERVAINHSTINFQDDFTDEVLIIPSGTDFVPETSTDGNDQDNDVDYTFSSYEIDGNIRTNERISLTATDGPINFGSTGSAISGRHLDFTARGPNGGINVDGANIETTAGNTGQGTKSITFDTTGDISAVGTTIDSDGGVEFLADGSIDLTNANILVEGNNDVVINAGESIDLTGATITIADNGDIRLIAGDTITLSSATLSVPTQGNNQACTDAPNLEGEGTVTLQGGADPLRTC